MARRHYSDRERAAALAIYDSTADQAHRLRDAARQAGVPVSTLRGWIQDRDAAAPADVRTQEKEALADVYDRVAFRAASLQDRVMAWLEEQPPEVVARFLTELNRTGGTATDKSQLLRGNPTARVETRDAPEVERRAARILTLMAPQDAADGKRKRE